MDIPAVLLRIRFNSEASDGVPHLVIPVRQCLIPTRYLWSVEIQLEEILVLRPSRLSENVGVKSDIPEMKVKPAKGR